MIRRSRRVVIATAVVAAALVPLLLLAAGWPNWWNLIAKEQTPMTWVQSVILVLTSAAALLVGMLTRMSRHSTGWHPTGSAQPTERTPLGWVAARLWWFVAAGFLAMALDERFAIHERVRDRILAPRDIHLPFLPWVGPGDFLMLLVALCGLVVFPLLYRALGPDPAARRSLVLGLVLAVIAVGADSIDPAGMSIEMERLEQTAEECLEYGAALGFLVAVVLRLLSLLGRVAVPTEFPSVSAETDAAGDDFHRASENDAALTAVPADAPAGTVRESAQ